ncbi:glycosyltransferase family 4 protein [uncultured Serinicoccus sp.]|uniref:glycosyltransferase family 4 protein n=1 Tax=uncultured Serinicoccus sp. TaxID=735514 RepID=UPI00261FA12C|nr:glycosyltransferase family 4 protein [uncultured Serinicoccus sp.]
MRILLLSHYYPPETGPPQLRWSALVRDLLAAGHEVDVVTPAPHYPAGRLLPGEDPSQVGRSHPGEHGETVHRVTFRRSTGDARSLLLDQVVAAADTVRTTWRRRDGLRPDVVIATVPGLPTALAGRAVATLLRVPLVLEMRDAWPDILGGAASGDRATPRAALRAGLVRLVSTGVTWLQRSADLVVTTTDSFAATLRERQVPRVVTVRNAHHGLPGPSAPVDTSPSGGPLHVVYVGTVGRAQGLETAVRAAHLARRDGVAIRLRVVGTGARLASVRGLARELQAPVEFAGPVTREQVAAHYDWCDTFLVCLRDWPGLDSTVPSKLYEALALGLHVSASATGETATIVRETGAGFATAPGDAQGLARAWGALAQTGPQQDRARMSSWVDRHASESGAAAVLLDALADLGDLAGPGHERVGV